MLGLHHVDGRLVARGILVSHDAGRQRGRRFGQVFTNRIRRRLPRAGRKRHLGEVAAKTAGVQRWPWRAVDQTGTVLDILVSAGGTSRLPSGNCSPALAA